MKTHGGAKWLLLSATFCTLGYAKDTSYQEVVRVTASAGSSVNSTNQAIYHPFSARTLTGRRITLPAPGRLTLIFTSGRSSLATAWQVQAEAVCARHAVLECYQAAPDSRGIRHSVPANFRDRTAVVEDGGQLWKPAVASQTPGDVYAILLAPDGTPLWQAAGRAGDSPPMANLEEMLQAADY